MIEFLLSLSLLGQVESAPLVSNVYQDIIRQEPSAKIYPGDKSTTVHEAIHGIHGRLRLKRALIDGVPSGAFYIPGKYIWLKNPNYTINDLLPTPTKTRRIGFYFPNKDWNDQPLYIIDELVAYTWDVFCEIQLLEKNEESNDGVVSKDTPLAIIEFTYLAEKMYKKNPSPELREIIDWSYVIYHESQKFQKLKVTNPWEKEHEIPNPIERSNFSTIGSFDK